MAKPNINSATAAAVGRATEEQVRAILSTVRRAVEEEEEHVSGAAGKLSVQRSMEWFLQGRKNKVLQLHHGDEADDAASSSCSN
jgi:hypothetical protein